MTHGRNAGIKRNRRPTGSVTVERRAQLSEEAAIAFEQAKLDSGNISFGLYLERLFHELKDSQGHLPALAPQLDLDEASRNQREAHTAAA